MTKTIKNRTIEFQDEHRVRLVNIFEEPMKDPETGAVVPGTVEKKIEEFLEIKRVRDTQRHNVEMLEQLTKDLERLLEKNNTAPDPLPARLQTLLADLELIRKWQAERNAVDKHQKLIDEAKEGIQRCRDAIEMCSAIFAKRREQFPNASVEPIDQVTP